MNNQKWKEIKKYGIGVYKQGNTFFSHIRIKGKYNYLGSFETPELANQAYWDKLKEISC